MHAGAAVGRRLVALFGSSSPAYTPPLSPLASIARIEIAKDGFETYSEALKVEAGKRARIDAQLRAIPKPTPQPTPRNAVVDTSKVYNNVASEVDALARKVSGKTISYPDAAPRLKSGDSVSITVGFVVNENGDVVDPKIVESGSKILDETVGKERGDSLQSFRGDEASWAQVLDAARTRSLPHHGGRGRNRTLNLTITRQPAPRADIQAPFAASLVLVYCQLPPRFPQLHWSVVRRDSDPGSAVWFARDFVSRSRPGSSCAG